MEARAHESARCNLADPSTLNLVQASVTEAFDKMIEGMLDLAPPSVEQGGATRGHLAPKLPSSSRLGNVTSYLAGPCW